MAVAQVPQCQSSHVMGTTQQHNYGRVGEENIVFLTVTLHMRHIGIENCDIKILLTLTITTK